MTEIRLIVGLGNPGPEYENTRHNAGFRVVDRLVSQQGGSWKNWSGLAAVASIDAGYKVILAKPQTYMNESGVAVKQLAEYYRIAPDGLLVVFDDFALPFGTLRLRLSGSAGGHNGLSSIIEHLSTSAFPRLRIGIGPLPPRISSVDYVLGKFSRDEEKTFDTILGNAADTLEDALKLGLDKAVSHMALRNQSETS